MRHRRTRRVRQDSGAGRPPWHVHEWACVYAIPTRDEETGRSIVGYVGQSAGVHRRDPETGLPLARLAEHKDTQWWAHLIVHPEIWIVWEGSCTQAELDIQEIAAIRYGVFHPGYGLGPAQRPVYNIDHNMDNPRRIPPWKVRERALKAGHIPPKRRPLSATRMRLPSGTRAARHSSPASPETAAPVPPHLSIETWSLVGMLVLTTVVVLAWLRILL